MDEIAGPKAEALIANLLVQPETARFESKRVSGKMVAKALEAICAFANTAGGTLALGLEDLAKATGPERLHGLAENPEAVDELRRKTLTHLLPAVDGLRWLRVACRLRDWMDRNGPLANSDLCQIAAVDTLKASKMLKRWVEQGVLLRDDSAGKRHTIYGKPVPGYVVNTPAPLSPDLDNEPTN